MKVELFPGRKGGTFNVSDNVKVSIPENQLFGKTDSVCGKIIDVNKRSEEYVFRLHEHEKLVSDMVVLVSKHRLKEPFQVHMRNFDSFDCEMFVIKPMIRNLHGDWTHIEQCQIKDGWTTFSTFVLDVFILLCAPKSEQFEISPSGGLLNFKLNHLISLRIPKLSYQTTITCTLSILPSNLTQLSAKYLATKANFSPILDVCNMSPFYNFDCPQREELRRSVTLKLPLPCWILNNKAIDGSNTDSASLHEVMIAQRWMDRWEIVESALKYTKNSVSFDTSRLARFCIVQPRDVSRRVRVKLAIPIFEKFCDKVGCEVLAFTCFAERKWQLWIECVPLSRVVDVISDRVKGNGLHYIKKSGVQSLNEMIISNGAVLEATLQGDFIVRRENPCRAEDEVRTTQVTLQFHSDFKDNYRCFEIEPRLETRIRAERLLLDKCQTQLDNADGAASHNLLIEEDVNVFTGQLTCNIFNVEIDRITQFNYDFEIDLKDMSDYLDWKPTPPPQSFDSTQSLSECKTKNDKLRTTVVSDGKRILAKRVVPSSIKPPSSTFLRLTTVSKQNVIKEPKVLSGRSLQVLSKEINQGLTLAVHLNMPDSVITGIGFDGLSRGCSLTDVTYKILLQWKRTSKDKESLVSNLVNALNIMGRSDIATVLTKHHKDNEELSVNCFQL